MTSTPHPTPGRLDRLSEHVERLTQDNPGPFTGSGTNSYLIGDRRSLWLLDPGEESSEHEARLLEAIGEREVLGVLVSHAHPDHWPLAPRLAERLEAPTLSFEERRGFTPTRPLADRETLRGAGVVLEALHTPGHAGDHLCFLLREESTVFSADLVMGWSTSIIAPPDGNLNQFLTSLERLIALEPRRLLPGHGPTVEDPASHMRELRAHRHERTAQALAALGQAAGTVQELVRRVYTDVDPKMHGAAAMSLLAHLEALVEEGRVVRSGGGNAAIYALAP